MEQQQFQENVSEWIRVMNARMSLIQEQMDDITGAVEEDLMTLSYQHKVIKDLRKHVLRISREIIFLKRVTPLKSE